jgi:hypothetical protein
MRYAIIYISSRNPSTTDENVDFILSQADQLNNQNGITGLLVYSNEHFFQLIEGEKNKILELFEKISNDQRHKNVIRFFEKEIFNSAYDGYYCDKVKDIYEFDELKLQDYLNYLMVLEYHERNAVLQVLKAMFPNSCEVFIRRL